MHHALHSFDSCPEVEISPEDLLHDPLMTLLIKRQQDQQQMPRTSTTLLLDLEASRLLLRLHPDRGVRRQVYEVAVQSRVQVTLEGLEDLADIRR